MQTRYTTIIDDHDILPKFLKRIGRTVDEVFELVEVIMEMKIPAAHNSTELDWEGNTLKHSGKAKIPLQAAKAPVLVGNGVMSGASANSGATITSQSSADGTITIDGSGNFTFPSAVKCYQVVLSNSSTYSFTEGSPTETAFTIYDQSDNNNDITLINYSATNWQILTRPDWPLLLGFTKDAIGYIPVSSTNPLKDAAGNDIQHKAGQTLVPDNPMQFVMPLVTAMLAADSGLNFWFDGAGVQNFKTVTEIAAYESDQYIYGGGKCLVCSEPQTGDCLLKTLTYLDSFDFLMTMGGDYLVDDDDNYLIV